MLILEFRIPWFQIKKIEIVIILETITNYGVDKSRIWFIQKFIYKCYCEKWIIRKVLLTENLLSHCIADLANTIRENLVQELLHLCWYIIDKWNYSNIVFQFHHSFRYFRCINNTVTKTGGYVPWKQTYTLENTSRKNTYQHV